MIEVKKPLSLLLSLLIVISLFTAIPFTAGAVTTDNELTSAICGDYEYKLSDDDTAKITNYKGSSTELEIPSSLDGYIVTRIDEGAFADCTRLISVKIPDSVKSIGYSAFYNCESLTSIAIPNSVTTIDDYAFLGCIKLAKITIPDSVTIIGNWAFEKCESLTSITIPRSVTSIGYRAFYDCISLKSLNVDAGNQYYSSLDGSLYNKEQTVLIRYDIGKNENSFVIPNTVTSIGAGAFENCTSLISITIPDSVTSIGDWAFDDCESLTSITLPDNITTISEGTFYNCKSLTSIKVPDGVTSICDAAFDGCENLLGVTIPDKVTRIGDYAFSHCENLMTATIGNSVTSIGNEAFLWCDSLTSVNIPDSVTSIGDEAFLWCTRLKNVIIPDSVTSIGAWAFGYYYDSENDTYVKVKDFTIHGYAGEEAERCANNNGFTFVDLSKPSVEQKAEQPEEQPVEQPIEKPVEKTTVTLSKTSGSVYVKGSTQIKASVKNGRGTTTYSSSNKKVAKVSKTGKVTGLKKGTATITVTNNGVKKTFKITVKNPKLNVKSKSLKKGKKFTLKIIGKIGKATFTSNNKKVAVVNKKGKITAKKKGKAIIKVKTNGITLKCTVRVK